MFYNDRIEPESLTGEQLDALLALGWYRMNQHLFTTSHVEIGDVYRVHWLRYHLPITQAHHSHRRIRKKNRHFRYTIEDFTGIGADHATLHQKYFASIDFEGASSILDCLYGEEPTDKNIFTTKCITVYDQDRPIAAGYFDLGETSAASILHFFDPEYSRFSPGKYLILLTIHYLQQHGYTLYYPGYVVQGLPKMDYKLFLDRYSSEYFDPRTFKWKIFEDSILAYNESEIRQITEWLRSQREES